MSLYETMSMKRDHRLNDKQTRPNSNESTAKCLAAFINLALSPNILADTKKELSTH